MQRIKQVTDFKLNSILIIAATFILMPAASPAEDGKDLFERKCSKCHTIDRALNKTKNHNEWWKTVKRMAGYSRGSIKENDVDKIVEYLTSGEKKK